MVAVFQAYDDIGMRATVSGHVDGPHVPRHHPVRPRNAPGGPAGRGRRHLPGMRPATISPSQGSHAAALPRPLRPYALHDGAVGAAALHAGVDARGRRRWRGDGTPFHTHIVETKMQAVTGPEFHGKTLIRYMRRSRPAASRATTIAHSIWVTDEDIELMGDAGVPSCTTSSPTRSSAPASRRCASCSTPASMWHSARTASAPTTRRACST